jgi:hypothetical protein
MRITIFKGLFLPTQETTEGVPHMDGNIYSVAQIGLQKNYISSLVEKVMNIFAEGCSQPPKSRFSHTIF